MYSKALGVEHYKENLRVIFDSLELFVHILKSKDLPRLGGYSPAASPGNPDVQKIVMQTHSYTMRGRKQITQHTPVFMPNLMCCMCDYCRNQRG